MRFSRKTGHRVSQPWLRLCGPSYFHLFEILCGSDLCLGCATTSFLKKLEVVNALKK